MIIGYTSGVFDLFHIGHVNLLRNSKAMCDKLIVGVSVDDLVSYKGKKSIIPFHERIEVVRSCKYVDIAIAQKNMNKATMVKSLNANFVFVGDACKTFNVRDTVTIDVNKPRINFAYVGTPIINKSIDFCGF